MLHKHKGLNMTHGKHPPDSDSCLWPWRNNLVLLFGDSYMAVWNRRELVYLSISHLCGFVANIMRGTCAGVTRSRGRALHSSRSGQRLPSSGKRSPSLTVEHIVRGSRNSEDFIVLSCSCHDYPDSAHDSSASQTQAAVQDGFKSVFKPSAQLHPSSEAVSSTSEPAEKD